MCKMRRYGAEEEDRGGRGFTFNIWLNRKNNYIPPQHTILNWRLPSRFIIYCVCGRFAAADFDDLLACDVREVSLHIEVPASQYNNRPMDAE